MGQGLRRGVDAGVRKGLIAICERRILVSRISESERRYLPASFLRILLTNSWVMPR